MPWQCYVLGDAETGGLKVSSQAFWHMLGMLAHLLANSSPILEAQSAFSKELHEGGGGGRGLTIIDQWLWGTQIPGLRENLVDFLPDV